MERLKFVGWVLLLGGASSLLLGVIGYLIVKFFWNLGY